MKFSYPLKKEKKLMPLNCRHAVLIVKPWLGVPKSTIYYERPSETPYWPITSLASCMQGPSQRTKVYTLTHHYIRSGKKKCFQHTYVATAPHRCYEVKISNPLVHKGTKSSESSLWPILKRSDGTSQPSSVTC